jgi:hypothetical protein
MNWKYMIMYLGLLWPCAVASAAQTTTIFDVLAATETLTVVGTTTIQGNTFSVGNSSFIVFGGNVGIATTAPVGLFTVANGTLTVQSSGYVGIGTTTPSALLHIVGVPLAGAGAQFLWISTYGAIRSGEVSGTQWDSINIGRHSAAFGFNNIASG